MGVTIAELLVADPPEAWEAAGFVVDADGACRIGTVLVRLAGRGSGSEAAKGIVGWTLRGLEADALLEGVDGIPTTIAGGPHDRDQPGQPGQPGRSHPNGVTGIDHVVLLSPELSRTVAAFAAIGLDPRRERDGELGGAPMRQVFYRLGEVILEVVGAPGSAAEGPSSLWGLTHVVDDIDAAVALLGEAGGRVKDAVQPGRRITTLRTRELGMSVRTALITPHTKR